MDLTTIAIAIQLIVLHRADGGEVTVIPAHITSMHARSPAHAGNKVVAGDARCVVWLADGKVLSVLETCDQVKAMLESVDPDRRR